MYKSRGIWKQSTGNEHRLQAESMLINSAPHMGLQVVGWKHKQSVRRVLQESRELWQIACVYVQLR